MGIRSQLQVVVYRTLAGGVRGQGPVKKEQGFVRGTKGRKVFRQWEQYCSSRTWQNWRAKIVWGGWDTEIKLGSVREQGLTHT